GAGDAAQLVVQLRQAVDGDADALQPGLGRLGDPGGGKVAGTGLHRTVDAVAADGADDLRPVAPQVGLAADQADLPGAQAGELIDDLEALLRAQLVGARPAGTRPAVLALEIAGEGNLPDDVNRDVPPEVVVGTETCGAMDGLGHENPLWSAQRSANPEGEVACRSALTVRFLLRLGDLQLESLQGSGDVAPLLDVLLRLAGDFLHLREVA